MSLVSHDVTKFSINVKFMGDNEVFNIPLDHID